MKIKVTSLKTDNQAQTTCVIASVLWWSRDLILLGALLRTDRDWNTVQRARTKILQRSSVAP